ncbi:MAG: type II toxin-antitoxin system HicB family antitoxin [Pirellulales bacterium]
MSDELRRRAEKLAQERPYVVQIAMDETTEEDEQAPMFFLTVRELPGCSAQGVTLEEALANLAEVKVDFIESLLDDGLPIPPSMATTTTSFSLEKAQVYDMTPDQDESFEDVLGRMVRPSHRVHVGEVSWEPEPII